MNRLAAASSPYLRQHLDNPVDWYPWGEEALARARREQRPILLSIGYSACHWCHVMAHESFEDPAIADLMNRLFVNIKVDREERPDLDRIYQLAHQLLTGRGGGWPLTMFLMPDQTPFFGGTYFPKVARHGLPAFPDLLQRVHDYYTHHRDELEDQNRSLHAVLRQLERADAGAEGPDDRLIEAALAQLREQFDPTHGGFGVAPKFPHPPSICLCLTQGVRRNDEALRSMALFSLGSMAQGGLYDQVGGGFFRYSVDDAWRIPHFEKMLYDNALLLGSYARACRAAGRTALFERVLRETGDWMMREMQLSGGGYAASLDADSEGREGAYYLWDRDEFAALLDGEQAAVATVRFGLDAAPNFEGRWHLRVAADLPQVAEACGISQRRAAVALSAAREKLLEARARRVRPGRDEKILAGWNGLAIGGMAAAGRLLERAAFVESATRALDFVRRTLWRGGRLAVCTHPDAPAGAPLLNGYLEDHVYLIDGILELLQARWRSADLSFAVALAEVVLRHFEDAAQGGFFTTSDDHEALILRTRPLIDESTPSGNAVAARVLGRLGALLGEPRYLEAAERTLRAARRQMSEAPVACCGLLLALTEQQAQPRIAVLRGASGPLEEWRRAAEGSAGPADLLFAIPDDATDLPPALAGKTARAPVTAYLCRGLSCGAPLTKIERLCAALEEQR